MKKTIILILAVLPIVLLVVIAFAGRILAVYQHIPVERVEFVDRFNNPYTDEFTFTVNQGSTKETAIIIYPTLASNKNVTYKSNDESICTIDENGVITGVHFGETIVSVTTEDGGKVAKMNVRVKADIPYSVTLSYDELTMIEGSVFQLEATVDAPVAVIKDVVYASSDTSIVKVDASGKLTAISEGTATITVTTVSGGLTDFCVVTVEKGELPIYFDFEGVEGITLVNNNIHELSLTTINLLDYLQTSDEVNIEDVVIKIQSGSSATLENGVLTFTKRGIVTIRAYVGNESNPDYIYEIKLVSNAI
ncbi:MAG: Ig domain-containing protein [Clostridia bacterium]|nr:Ig domain-containing protein [Clostridia bacterium]